MYLKNLQNQISRSSHRNTLFHGERETNIAEDVPASSHPMTARLGLDAVPAVRQSIEACEDINVFWHNVLENGRESFVGCVQLYSDKSKMTLKTNSFEFYPLHVSLLNFREGYRRSLVTHGQTIVAYLPVGFVSNEERYSPKKDGTSGPKQRISLLHSALVGMECENSDGVQRLCHAVLSMYCADIPEAKDINCVKWGTNTNQPCHRCHVKSDELNQFGQYAICEIVKTVGKIQKSNDASDDMLHLRASQRRSARQLLRSEAKKLLDDISVSSRIPALFNWPFCNCHSLLDVYNVFKFEPLHNLHLGISKLIKNCSLSREDLFTASVRGKKDNPKTFLSCRSHIIGEVNVLLQRIQRESPGPELNIDFSSKSNDARVSGLSQKDGIHSMLEGREMKALDQVSPFIGALLDRCCGETEAAPSTFIYVKYVELIQHLLRREKEAAMTERAYEEIETIVFQFMSGMTDLFGDTHASECETLKFNLLTHLTDALRSIGSIASADAGFYESSHTQFKHHYKQTSRRNATALFETVERIGQHQALEKYEEGKIDVEWKETAVHCVKMESF